MIARLLTLILFASGVDLPRIGCWREGEGRPARELFGVAGNLVARDMTAEDACENAAEWSEPDDNGVRTLALDARWRLARAEGGERYLLYRNERHELPQ